MPREITRIEVPDPEPMHQTPEGGAETQGVAYRLTAPAVATEPLAVTAPDGTTFRWVPTELCYRDESGRMDYIVGSAPAGVQVRDREARYQRTFPVADDVFKAEAERVKHWVILHEPPRAPAEYLSGAIEFGVTGLVSGIHLPEGRHNEIEAGPFRLPKPVAKDLAGREIEGYYEVVAAEGGQQLFVWFTAPEILGATYPVVLDPTIVSETTNIFRPRAAIAPDGTMYVAYTVGQFGPHNLRVYRSNDGGNTWQHILTTEAAEYNGYNAHYGIAVTMDGSLHLVYSSTPSSGGCILYHRVFANGSWSEPSQLAFFSSGTSPSSYIVMDVGPNGVLHLAYQFFRWGQENGNVEYRRYVPGQGWALSRSLGLPSGISGGSVVELAIVATNDGGAIVFCNSYYRTVDVNGNISAQWVQLPIPSGLSVGRPIVCVRDDQGNLHAIGVYGSFDRRDLFHWIWGGGAWTGPTVLSTPYPPQDASASSWGGMLRVFVRMGSSGAYSLHRIDRQPGGQWGSWANVFSGDVSTPPASPPRTVSEKMLVVYGVGSQSPYRLLATVYNFNTPPNAPILGQRDPFDANEDTIFTWTFADSAGDTQSAYQLLIKRASDGTVVYDTGKVVSSAQQHTLPGGTLQNGVQYRWTVRTWDRYDAVGPYATEQAFVTSAKPTVAITDPASDGTTVATSEVTIQWSMSDPESKGQSAYRVVLKDGGGNVVHDSGQVQSAEARAYTVTDLQNNTSYTIEVTVWDGDGVASQPATRTFSTSFTPPPQPTLAVEGLDGRVRVRISNHNDGAQIPADRNDVYRRRAGETGNGVRIATGVAPDGVVEDYAVASGVAYEYRVVAIGTNGTTAASPWVAAPVLRLTGAWLHDPAAPANTIRQFRVAADRSENWEPVSETFQFAGRKFPVAEFGEQTDQRVRTAIIVLPDSLADLHALRRLAELRTVLCYRDSAGRRIFGVLGPLNIRDERHGGYTVEIEIQAVDYDEAV